MPDISCAFNRSKSIIILLVFAIIFSLNLFTDPIINAQETRPENTTTPTIEPIPSLAFEGVSANDEWTPYILEIDSSDMALVPVGCFQMGSDSRAVNGSADGGEQCFNGPFWIDHYEVTNAKLTDFLNANGNVSADGDVYLDSVDADRQISAVDEIWIADEGFEDHPAIEISWFAARDYCTWQGGRLPTEAEWEYSARGVDNSIYPTGNEWNPDSAVWNSSGTAIVGSIPEGASWVGTLDMTGNVWEWTASPFLSYPYNPENEDMSDREISRVMRGGSWYISEVTILRAASRMASTPDVLNDTGGFRCVRDYDE